MRVLDWTVGTCPQLRTFNTCALTWRGSQALVRTNCHGCRCALFINHITWQRVEQGMGWVGGMSINRIPRVTEVSGQDRR